MLLLGVFVWRNRGNTPPHISEPLCPVDLCCPLVVGQLIAWINSDRRATNQSWAIEMLIIAAWSESTTRIHRFEDYINYVWMSCRDAAYDSVSLRSKPWQIYNIYIYIPFQLRSFPYCVLPYQCWHFNGWHLFVVDMALMNCSPCVCVFVRVHCTIKPSDFTTFFLSSQMRIMKRAFVIMNHRRVYCAPNNADNCGEALPSAGRHSFRWRTGGNDSR